MFSQLLTNLAEAANLKSKIKSLFAGEHLNLTEDRAVLHPALRAPRDEVPCFCVYMNIRGAVS